MTLFWRLVDIPIIILLCALAFWVLFSILNGDSSLIGELCLISSSLPIFPCELGDVKEDVGLLELLMMNRAIPSGCFCFLFQW